MEVYDCLMIATRGKKRKGCAFSISAALLVKGCAFKSAALHLVGLRLSKKRSPSICLKNATLLRRAAFLDKRSPLWAFLLLFYGLVKC